MRPIELAIPIFSGFLQSLGSPGSGMVGLEADLYAICNGTAGVRIRLFPWHTDVEDVAESFWRYRPEDKEQHYVVVNYSYGGQTAADFCWALERRGGCRVVELACCDPVRRWSYLPGIAAMTGFGSISVPSSIVDHVTLFRQSNPRWDFGRGWRLAFRPAGHAVKGRPKDIPTDEYSTISGHSYIDNDSKFRDIVRKAVERELALVKRSAA